MTESGTASAQLARAHQALYRLGARVLAGTFDTAAAAAVADYVRTHILPLHPDPAVRRAWRAAVEHLDGAADPETEAFLRAVPMDERSWRPEAHERLGELRRWFRELGGVSPHPEPDHLSSELELASLLAGAEADAWQSGAEREAVGWRSHRLVLLEDHLLSWLPDLARLVGRPPTPAAVRATVDAALATARFDAHWLAAAGEEEP